MTANDEIILDIDIEKELQNEIPKLKSILHFILENENYLVELSSHTSCVGNLVVNLKTSEARAEKLKNELFNLVESNNFLLVEKKLTVIGHGEFYPLIKCGCAHCAEQSHQHNDRVVIKLIPILPSGSAKPLKNKFAQSLKDEVEKVHLLILKLKSQEK